MRMRTWSRVGVMLMVVSLVACGGDDDGGDGSTATETECTLADDPGAPGQYADTCVMRSWVEPYVGKYSSQYCVLTIATDTSVPAVFTLEISGDKLPGTYTIDWEGGSGMGNDSYYRFTTDTTYATTSAENFTAAVKVSDTEEQSVSLRVDNVNATPAFSGNFQRTVTSPFLNELVGCGEFSREP
ncbi:hypothetical protein [Chondromyces apiculatus]|uniref:Lipoprotein n=1 Tax=Chondromyces apiculatus DSM 436 TaxID=1192034 RepID=A0A017SWI4_9BACT|nr:hypothetical protein [Chondromyces apiculatus]EYF00965.1 Hypothetical protein CAP_8833 [Chondromyces apiculatus DSM 436]